MARGPCPGRRTHLLPLTYCSVCAPCLPSLWAQYRAPRHRRLLARIMALPPWLLSGHTAAGSSAAYINQEAQLVESSALTIMVSRRP